MDLASDRRYGNLAAIINTNINTSILGASDGTVPSWESSL
jgi:hypothetical protein